ncbi:hypothetical protein M501DRAFT_926337 [Patellaria atrata CBS 101060]|uniref:Homeobox domain-containing protein n=1 Tax=Patellaria atrata CBS 101060 TaxID=1346257 RepID=A0A9P4SHP0_9PEZI|nr:hypothetical protein M501DRAFT_926337 [Patellaria atrata CBS 101060]
MVDGNLFIPLSPPCSPRMSGYSAITAESDWQNQQNKSLESGATSDNDMALVHAATITNLPLDLDRRPSLRTHKSFPYPLKPTHSFHQHTNSLNGDTKPTAPQRERITISNLEEVDSNELPTVTFGGSAPASPISRLTPPSPNGAIGEGLGENQEMNDLDFDTGDNNEEEISSEQKQPVSAAELRAQKRKMKRFRLTHNQTRFLMSEFARQAHPDAAHRERLAREIPGLSPRQVQVWFQNRRAKLKRLTSDDRERMMRSRALPEDFDMAQALHSPFGAPHGVGTPLGSPAGYNPGFPEGNMMRPLSIDTLRRLPEGAHMSPTGISPAFGGFTFTPPQSATEGLSPVSPTGEGSPFNYPGPMDQNRRGNPFVGSPNGFTSHPQIPRLQIHDRVVRTRAESLSSPLRTSMSYGNDANVNGQNGHSLHALDDGQRGMNNSVMPYGIGYSYSQIPGFQAASATRMRSFSSGVPRRIELSTHYQPNRNNTTPQTANFPNYQHSPLSSPQDYHIPHMSAPHHITTFQNSWRQDVGHQDGYQPVGTVIGEVIEGSSPDHEDNENGVQMQNQY